MAKVYMMLQVLCVLVLVLHVSAHTCLIANAYIALAITSGVIALANAIPDMGAMTSLNLASNCLCGLDEYGEGAYDDSGRYSLFSFLFHIASSAHSCLVVHA
jgi:hypothetical protein